MYNNTKLTKYVNTHSCIHWTEKTIHELNEPPCDEESHGNRKENNTAEHVKIQL